ncbi:MAG: DUF2752 domain-containing protein [Planctomycetes bacterium]|nr:DUF2752 domain-containing protein [Planctomycetota bacterium]
MQTPPVNPNATAPAADHGDVAQSQCAPDATFHWVFLGISSVVVLLAVLLQVQGEEQVVIPALGVPLPGTCTFKQYVGVDCPGCGLTRCFVSMGHAQLERAWHFNPVGIAFFVVVVSQIPFRAFQLWRLKRGVGEIRLGTWGYSVMVFVLVGLLAQWIVRMIIRFT